MVRLWPLIELDMELKKPSPKDSLRLGVAAGRRELEVRAASELQSGASACCGDLCASNGDAEFLVRSSTGTVATGEETGAAVDSAASTCSAESLGDDPDSRSRSTPLPGMYVSTAGGEASAGELFGYSSGVVTGDFVFGAAGEAVGRTATAIFSDMTGGADLHGGTSGLWQRPT